MQGEPPQSLVELLEQLGLATAAAMRTRRAPRAAAGRRAARLRDDLGRRVASRRNCSRPCKLPKSMPAGGNRCDAAPTSLHKGWRHRRWRPVLPRGTSRRAAWCGSIASSGHNHRHRCRPALTRSSNRLAPLDGPVAAVIEDARNRRRRRLGRVSGCAWHDGCRMDGREWPPAGAHRVAHCARDGRAAGRPGIVGRGAWRHRRFRARAAASG